MLKCGHGKVYFRVVHKGTPLDMPAVGRTIEDVTSSPQLKVVQYREELRNFEPRCHWGQRKLLMAEIEFLTTALAEVGRGGASASRRMPADVSNVRRTVVYAGAAPGTHILTLIKLFPGVRWELFDPRPFEAGLSSHRSVTATTGAAGLFDDDTAARMAARYAPGELIFLSDIRDGEPEDHVAVSDMQAQARWCLIMQPSHASLKFRLPYSPGRWPTTAVALVGNPRLARRLTPVAKKSGVASASMMVYLDGEAVTQTNAPMHSTETRLWVRRDPGGKYGARLYDVVDYERRCQVFNDKVRLYSLAPSPAALQFVPGHDDGYESVREWTIVEEYLRGRGADASDRDVALELFSIDRHIGRACGRDLATCSIATLQTYGKRRNVKPDVSTITDTWAMVERLYLVDSLHKQLAKVRSPAGAVFLGVAGQAKAASFLAGRLKLMAAYDRPLDVLSPSLRRRSQMGGGGEKFMEYYGTYSFPPTTWRPMAKSYRERGALAHTTDEHRLAYRPNKRADPTSPPFAYIQDGPFGEDIAAGFAELKTRQSPFFGNDGWWDTELWYCKLPAGFYARKNAATDAVHKMNEIYASQYAVHESGKMKGKLDWNSLHRARTQRYRPLTEVQTATVIRAWKARAREKLESSNGEDWTTKTKQRELAILNLIDGRSDWDRLEAWADVKRTEGIEKDQLPDIPGAWGLQLLLGLLAGGDYTSHANKERLLVNPFPYDPSNDSRKGIDWSIILNKAAVSIAATHYDAKNPFTINAFLPPELFRIVTDGFDGYPDEWEYAGAMLLPMNVVRQGSVDAPSSYDRTTDTDQPHAGPCTTFVLFAMANRSDGSLRLVNFRNNLVDFGDVTERKQVLYHELVQLMAMSSDNGGNQASVDLFVNMAWSPDRGTVQLLAGPADHPALKPHHPAVGVAKRADCLVVYGENNSLNVPRGVFDAIPDAGAEAYVVHPPGDDEGTANKDVMVLLPVCMVWDVVRRCPKLVYRSTRCILDDVEYSTLDGEGIAKELRREIFKTAIAGGTSRLADDPFRRYERAYGRFLALPGSARDRIKASLGADEKIPYIRMGRELNPATVDREGNYSSRALSKFKGNWMERFAAILQKSELNGFGGNLLCMVPNCNLMGAASLLGTKALRMTACFASVTKMSVLLDDVKKIRRSLESAHVVAREFDGNCVRRVNKLVPRRGQFDSVLVDIGTLDDDASARSLVAAASCVHRRLREGGFVVMWFLMPSAKDSRFARALSAFMSQFEDISDTETKFDMVTSRPAAILVMRGYRSGGAASGSVLGQGRTDELEAGLNDPCTDTDALLGNTRVSAKHSKIFARTMDKWSEAVSRLIAAAQRRS
jgi:hypothetical protein